MFPVSIHVEDKSCTVYVSNTTTVLTGLTPEQAVTAKKLIEHAYCEGVIKALRKAENAVRSLEVTYA